jgi:hypothetical protein
MNSMELSASWEASVTVLPLFFHLVLLICIEWFHSCARKSQHFMESEASLPCLQEPTLRPYLSHMNPVHTSHHISLRSIFILFSHLLLSHTSGLFPADFPSKTWYALPFHACYMPAQSRPWFNYSNNIWWRVQIMKVLVTPFNSTKPESNWIRIRMISLI